MEIISRQDAIRQGLSKYFTGEPCKNNHVAERYLQSSACSQCVNPTSSAPRPISASTQAKLELERMKLEQRERRLRLAEQEAASKSAARLEREKRKQQTESRLSTQKVTATERRQNKAGLTPVNLCCVIDRLPSVKALVHMWAQLRCPSIELSDLVINRNDGDLHFFRCFPEDKMPLIELTNKMYSEDSREFWERERVRIHGENLRDVEAEIGDRSRKGYYAGATQ